MFDICEKYYLRCPETPVFYLYVKEDARVVALPILETALLMCFKPKSHYLIPLVQPQNRGGAYSSTETKTLLWSWSWVHISRNGPAFPHIYYKIGSPPFLPNTLPICHLLVISLLRNPFIKGLPKLHFSYEDSPNLGQTVYCGGPQNSFGTWSIKLIRTAAWGAGKSLSRAISGARKQDESTRSLQWQNSNVGKWSLEWLRAQTLGPDAQIWNLLFISCVTLGKSLNLWVLLFTGLIIRVSTS